MLGELEGLGLEDWAVSGNLVSGFILIEALHELPNLSSLRFVRPAYREMNDAELISNATVGKVTDQGALAMRADEARRRGNVDGTGITVGVISDSYNTSKSRIKASDDIASGDLPAGGVNVLKNSSSPGTDEGRAMLQLVHDIAPGADLAFYTEEGGQSAMVKAIRALAGAGADVIVDDVTYYAEPMFQDGPIAQAVNEVVARDIAYFSSAGNSARKSYDSAFKDSGSSQTMNVGGGGSKTYKLHDFSGNGDFTQRITIPGCGQK